MKREAPGTPGLLHAPCENADGVSTGFLVLSGAAETARSFSCAPRRLRGTARRMREDHLSDAAVHDPSRYRRVTFQAITIHSSA